MHVLLVTTGVAGDVHPFLSTGAALVRRGHLVTLASDGGYRAFAERAGLGFASLGAAPGPNDLSERTRREMTKPGKASIAYLRDIVGPRLVPMFRVLDAMCSRDRPDVIACHHTAFCVPWVARRHEIPWAMGAVAPGSLPSVEEPNMYPGMPDRDRYPRWSIRLGMALATRSIARAVDPAINRARAELGMDPGRRFLFDEMLSGGATLGFWSRTFRAEAGDDPRGTHIVGFPWFDGAADDAWRLPIERFLAGGEAPVLVTMGTSVPHAVKPMLAAAARACAALGRRALLLAGRAEFIPEGLGPHAMAMAYAPIGEVLPRCASAIHHGGLGTLARCLRAGVPMICVPHLHDQFDNARRARMLGVSITLRASRATEAGFAEALQRLLHSTPMREASRRVALAMGDEDGGEGAASVLEGLASG